MTALKRHRSRLARLCSFAWVVGDGIRVSLLFFSWLEYDDQIEKRNYEETNFIDKIMGYKQFYRLTRHIDL
jgi:hypothetical protein